MSVASKTKTKVCTTVVLGFVAALSSLPTWASTTPGVITAVDPDVISTQSNQDLSELRTRLKARFSWVSTEVRSLIDGTTSVGDSFHGAAVRTLDVRQGIWVKPAISRQDSFDDIENDPYRTYINRLAAYGVLSSSDKFYPQNYFRIDDFVWLISKLYKKTTGQSLVSQELLGLDSSDGFVTKGMLQKIMYSLDSVKTVAIDGNPYDTLIRAEWAYYLVRMFDLPVLSVTDDAISGIPSTMFTDIVSHPFASAITTLASLGIVSSTAPKFYPDNYVRHYDFVILFVNSLLVHKNQLLTPSLASSQFADVEPSASYLPQLSYAADHGLIDYIISSKRGQLYFGPNDFISKREVYQILAKTLDIQIVYDEDQAAQQKISRGELAELLVESFEFSPKTTSSSDSLSWNSIDSSQMSVLIKLRTLLSMI